jgi:uncharacterized coiled-coil protein SlyX
VKIYRAKTGSTSKVNMFVHADSLYACPFHALATFMVVNADTSLFRSLTQKTSSSQYTNSLLDLLCEKLQDQVTSGLTSKSLRSGSSTHVGEHPDIQLQWVLPRGGWSMEGVQTVFHYVFGTYKTDSRVGRILSGWLKSGEGGFIPSIDDKVSPFNKVSPFDKETQNKLKAYSSHIFSVYFQMPVKLRLKLCTVLIMHYKEVFEEFGTAHLLIDSMHNRAAELQITPAMLSEWSAVLKQRFLEINSPFLRLKDWHSVADQTYKDALDTVVHTAQKQYLEHVEIKHTVKSMETTINGLNQVVTAQSAVITSQNAAILSLTAQVNLLVQHFSGQRSSTSAVGPSVLLQQNIAHDVIGFDDVVDSSILFGSAVVESSVPQRKLVIPPMFNKRSRAQFEQSSASSANVSLPVAEDGATIVQNGLSIEFSTDEALKGLTVQNCIEKWFVQRLHSKVVTSPKNLQNMRKIARIIAYSKASAPLGTIIPAEPELSDIDQHEQWVKTIHKFAYDADARIIKLRHIVRPRDNQLRDRNVHSSVWAAVKDLTRLVGVVKEKGMASPFQYGNTADHATSEAYNWNTEKEVTERKVSKKPKVLK